MSIISKEKTLMNLGKRDYVGISLWITSEMLTIEMISQYIGLEANYSQRLGDPVGQTKRKYERHSWNLGERLYVEQGEHIGNHTEQFFNKFFQTLECYALKIKELSRQNSVSVEIIYNVSDMPFVGLSSEQVQAIASLGARISLDIMVYESISE